MEVFNDVHVSGQLSMKSASLPAGSISDADVAAAAALQATKFQSQQQIRYSQPLGIDVVDETCLAHICRLPTEVIAVDVTPIIPPTTPTPGITITTLQAGAADVNEIQLLTLYGTFSGGNFTLTFNGQTTANIAPSDNAATVKTRLEDLSNIDPGDLTVTGTLSGGMSIEFGGSLAGTNVALLTANVSGLTGASLHADVSTTTPGVDGENQTLYLTANDASSPGNPLLTIDGNASVSSGTFDLTFNVGAGNVTLTNIAYDISLADLLQLIWDDQDGGDPVLIPRVAINGLTMNSAFGSNLVGVGVWGLKTVSTFSIDSTNLVGGTYTAGITQGGQGSINNLGGTWRLRVDGGSYTTTIAPTASGATIQAAIEALAEVGAGNVTVTQFYKMDGTDSQQGLLKIEFVGDLAGIDSGLVEVDTSSITGGIVELWEWLDAGGGTNEVQTLTMTGTPTQGSVAVTFDGQTATLPYNCSSANADTLLEALSSIGAGGVTVSGGPWPGTALVVTFNGNGLQFSDVPEMTTNNSALWYSLATTQTAVPGQNEIQQIAITGNPTGGTFTLTFSGQTTAAIAFNASNATVDTRLEDLSNIGSGDITIGGGTLPGTAITVTFGGSLAKTNVPQLTGDASSLTNSPSTYTVDVGIVREHSTVFVSILSAAITVSSASAARTPIVANVVEPDLLAGSILVVKVDETTGSDQGEGLNVVIHTRSFP